MNKMTLSSPIRASYKVVVAELFVRVILPVELIFPFNILLTTFDISRGVPPFMGKFK
jgi:hypothetical protein